MKHIPMDDWHRDYIRSAVSFINSLRTIGYPAKFPTEQINAHPEILMLIDMGRVVVTDQGPDWVELYIFGGISVDDPRYGVTMAEKWRTTKQAGTTCHGCGQSGRCTISPDGRKSKCWKDNGKLHPPMGSSAIASGGSGYIEEHNSVLLGVKR